MVWARPELPTRWLAGDHPAFVGRVHELRAIMAAWELASGGARQVMFVGGASGSGKSRLLAEVCLTLRGSGAALLVGSCVAEFGPAFQPFIEPVEELAAALAAGTVQLDEREGPDIADVLLRLDAVSRSDGSRPDATSPARARDYQRELYDAAVAAVRSAARAAPVVLVLEDLHWSGETALHMLRYLVERTSESRLLILATHRTTAPDRSRPLTATLADLARIDGVGRVELGGLSRDDIAQYLGAEAGVPASAAGEAARLMHERSGGNPFFLRELWRDLRERGGLRSIRLEGFAAPASVRDMVQARIDALTEPHRHVIELAAVIGQEFDTATLLAASSTGAPETLAALDEAVAVGILEPRVDADDELRFPHALMRQAVLDVTPRSRVIHGHARVAEALERSPVAVHLRVQRMAHHYASASRLGYAPQAVRYLIEAAGIAARSLAHVDAATLLERAASMSVTAEQRHELLLSAAKSYILAADFAKAMALSEAVATSATGDPRLRAAITYEAASWHPGHPGHRAAELLRDAMRTVTESATDRTSFTRGLAGLGRALGYAGATAEAAALGDRAIHLAARTGDEALLADALQASLQHPFDPGDVAVRQRRAAQLSELSARTGDMEHHAIAAYWRASLSYMSGDAAGLALGHAELGRAAHVSGQSFWDYIVGCMTYAKQFLVGDFAAAQRTCAGLVDLGGSFGTDDTEGPFGIQMYMLHRELGGLEHVRRLITGNEPLAGHWLPGLLALYTELGLAEPARRVLERVMSDGLQRYRGSADCPGILAFLAEATIFLEDVDAARELRPLLAEYSGMNLVLAPFVALFGSADRYLGELDALLGSGDPALSFARALQLDVRTGAHVHQAYTLAARAAHRRASGAPQRDVLQDVAAATALAQPINARRVLSQLARVGPTITPDRGSGTAADAPVEPIHRLTTRECEVLQLVAHGMSNRAIATELFISESTAANHVRSILMKTGCRNRTQAALYASGYGRATEQPERGR